MINVSLEGSVFLNILHRMAEKRNIPIQYTLSVTLYLYKFHKDYL